MNYSLVYRTETMSSRMHNLTRSIANSTAWRTRNARYLSPSGHAHTQSGLRHYSYQITPLGVLRHSLNYPVVKQSSHVTDVHSNGSGRTIHMSAPANQQAAAATTQERTKSDTSVAQAFYQEKNESFQVWCSDESKQDALKISTRCIERLEEIASKEKYKELVERGEFKLRVGVRAGGCDGFEYALQLDEEPVQGDDIVYQHGVARIVVDDKALEKIEADADFQSLITRMLNLPVDVELALLQKMTMDSGSKGSLKSIGE